MSETREMTGQELVDRWIAFIRRFVVLNEGQALTVVLWVLNTWVYDKFSAVPYLELWAMTKRTGKSTLAEIMSLLSRGGRILASVRVLQIVRMIEIEQGEYVPFIEEAERFNSGGLTETRSILATGYRKGAVHEIASAKGGVRYRTFCPKAFVLIGNLHEILRDRCISIRLERGTPASNWTNERYAATDEANDLIIAWRDVAKRMDVIKTDAGARFHAVDPTWLVSARDRELWTPLFSLAAALRLNDKTTALLKRASVDLSSLKTLPAFTYHPGQEERVSDDHNAAEAVLRDALVSVRPGEATIPTAELLNRLHSIDESPWRVWKGDGLNAITLGALLDRFGVKSLDVQIGKGRKERRIVKGYKVSELRAVKV